MSEVVDIHKKNGSRKHFDVYIGRRVQYHKEFTKDSKWGNKFYSRLDLYEQYIRKHLWDELDELKGKILGCWCVNTKELSPLQCHGQVLMKLLREKEANKEPYLFLKPAPGSCCPEKDCILGSWDRKHCRACGADCNKCSAKGGE